MVKKVPSLSASGWLSEISERADALMAYYISSEHSQSYIYSGQITSLIYHIQQNGDNLSRLESRVEQDLGIYLKRYFEEVEISVSTDLPDANDPNRINLTIDCIIVDNGYRYSLGREIKAENNRVVKTFDTVNGVEL